MPGRGPAGGTVVAVLTTVLIALLRHSGVAVSGAGGGEDVLMSMFRRAMEVSDQGDAVAVRNAAERAFRVLFLMSAGVSLIAPFFVIRLKEKTLRGSPAAAAKAAAAVE